MKLQPVVGCSLAVLVWLLVACSSARVNPNPQRDLAGRKLSSIRSGTPQELVISYLGPPSEWRTNRSQAWENEIVAFAYGAQKPGQFAEYGMVAFDKSNRVIQATSPTRGYAIRFGAEEFMPWLNKAYPESNILCVITGVKSDYSVPESEYQLRQIVSYRIKNLASHACDLWIRGSLQLNSVFEVYDERRVLFYRTDYGLMGTRWPGPPDSVYSDFSKVHLAPGETISCDTRIWLSTDDFGKPPPGSYYVRVGFGLDDEHFAVSKAVKFKVP